MPTSCRPSNSTRLNLSHSEFQLSICSLNFEKFWKFWEVAEQCLHFANCSDAQLRAPVLLRALRASDPEQRFRWWQGLRRCRRRTALPWQRRPSLRDVFTEKHEFKERSLSTARLLFKFCSVLDAPESLRMFREVSGWLSKVWNVFGSF